MAGAYLGPLLGTAVDCMPILFLLTFTLGAYCLTNLIPAALIGINMVMSSHGLRCFTLSSHRVCGVQNDTTEHASMSCECGLE